MKIECYVCGETLNDMGYLFFSCPVGDSAHTVAFDTSYVTVNKYHLCKTCGYDTWQTLYNSRTKRIIETMRNENED